MHTDTHRHADTDTDTHTDTHTNKLSTCNKHKIAALVLAGRNSEQYAGLQHQTVGIYTNHILKFLTDPRNPPPTENPTPPLRNNIT